MKSKSVAIIQARMGSTRLPGKSLRPFGSSTLLGYLIERIGSARMLDEVVVATTELPADDLIEKAAAGYGVRCVRGSEADVLGRYLTAAREAHADIVVRVTGDNPFTDPGSIDRTVEAVVLGYDYAIEMNMPVGTTGEALSRSALERIDRIADKPEWREHVTLYAKQNPGVLRCAFLSAPAEIARPDLSFTIDHAEEYLAMREIERQMPGPYFMIEEAIWALEGIRFPAAGAVYDRAPSLVSWDSARL